MIQPYMTQYVAVFAPKEAFSTVDYANVIIEGYELDAGPEKIDGITAFRQEAESKGDTCTCLAAVCKSDDAFRMIQFAAKSSNFEKQKDNILFHARSVTF